MIPNFYKHNGLHAAILTSILIACFNLKSVSCPSPQQSCGVFKIINNFYFYLELLDSTARFLLCIIIIMRCINEQSIRKKLVLDMKSAFLDHFPITLLPSNIELRLR